jgi:hypothetical protein
MEEGKMQPHNPYALTFVSLPVYLFATLSLYHSPALAQGILSFTEEARMRNVNYPIKVWQGNFSQFQGFGMAVIDLDNDGDQDLVIMGRQDGVVGFFENLGKGAFADRSSRIDGTPLLVLSTPSGIAAADYNGDGLIDLYITQQTLDRNVLFRNDGNFHFTDVAAAADVDNTGFGQAAAWGDFDNDGWLDLYICNYTAPPDQADPRRRNQLFRNLGDGTFENVGAALGVDDFGLSFAAAWSDIDRNGTLDLYLSNDRGTILPPNKLWRNDGGTFTSLCPQSGTCLNLFAMCVAAGDFDGNGFSDFYVTNIPGAGGYMNGINPLLLGNGDGTFIEAASHWNVDHELYSWAGIFFDFDNDGWLDVYVNNLNASNTLYRNTGVPPAVNVTTQCMVGGSTGFSFNTAVGDIDNDGDLDLLLNNYGAKEPANVELFINHQGSASNWARFTVVGTTPGNRHAIGANIDLRTGAQWQWRELFAGGNNFKAQSELVFHFGLGDAAIIDEIVVKWPGGSPTRTLTNYPVNKKWTIYPRSTLGDADGNGIINVSDLLALINAWGTVRPGTEICDTDGNGVINVTDLLFLINNWS